MFYFRLWTSNYSKLLTYVGAFWFLSCRYNRVFQEKTGKSPLVGFPLVKSKVSYLESKQTRT